MSGRKPDYEVFTSEEVNGKSYYTKIGSAWKTQTKDGVSVILKALPLNGKLIMFPPRDEKPQTQQRQSSPDLDDEIPF